MQMQPLGFTAAGFQTGGATPFSDINSAGIQDIIKLTQAEYDALNPPDANTLYIITT